MSATLSAFHIHGNTSPVQIQFFLCGYANMISLASAGSMLTRSASILSSSSTSSSACTPTSDCIGSVLDYAAAMSQPKVSASRVKASCERCTCEVTTLDVSY